MPEFLNLFVSREVVQCARSLFYVWCIYCTMFYLSSMDRKRRSQLEQVKNLNVYWLKPWHTLWLRWWRKRDHQCIFLLQHLRATDCCWKKSAPMNIKTAIVNPSFVMIALVTVGLPSAASASHSSRRNIFKGVDTPCTDGTKTSTRPNIFGGVDTYDKSGRKISSSQPNIFGGSSTKSNTGKTQTVTKPTIFGGYDVFDENGRKTQTCKPNILKGYTYK